MRHLRDRIQVGRALPNKWLDRSGRSVFLNMNDAAKVESKRAAESTQTVGRKLTVGGYYE
jgi:hypothetical protein